MESCPMSYSMKKFRKKTEKLINSNLRQALRQAFCNILCMIETAASARDDRESGVRGGWTLILCAEQLLLTTTPRRCRWRPRDDAAVCCCVGGVLEVRGARQSSQWCRAENASFVTMQSARALIPPPPAPPAHSRSSVVLSAGASKLENLDGFWGPWDRAAAWL